MAGAESKPVETGRATDEMRDAFASALRVAMMGVRQSDLAGHVGLSPDAVAKWLSGTTEPQPRTVFAVERYLELAPGELSRHLGYVPVGEPPAVLDAIERDPRLTPEARTILIGTYRSARRSH